MNNYNKLKIQIGGFTQEENSFFIENIRNSNHINFGNLNYSGILEENQRDLQYCNNLNFSNKRNFKEEDYVKIENSYNDLIKKNKELIHFIENSKKKNRKAKILLDMYYKKLREVTKKNKGKKEFLDHLNLDIEKLTKENNNLSKILSISNKNQEVWKQKYLNLLKSMIPNLN